jgi:hypothetical protein
VKITFDLNEAIVPAVVFLEKNSVSKKNSARTAINLMKE